MNPNLEQSLAHLLHHQVKERGSETAFLEKHDGQFKEFDFNYAGKKSYSLAKSFIKEGLEKGERIAIMSANCLKWALVDYGALSAALVDVPIYPTLTPESIDFILNNSDSKLLFVQNEELLEKVLEIPRENLKQVKRIILMHGESAKDDRIMSFDDFLILGEALDDAKVDERLDAIDNQDLATIIYTSGTTGVPKGVMLSHENILDNVTNSIECLPFEKSDEILFLSFLPLSHIFERMTGHYLAMKVAGKIAYAESIDTVAQNMTEVRPTAMASVPRLYEKMYDRIIENVEHGSGLKKKLFYWAISVGKEVVNKYISVGKEARGILALKYKLASTLVFSKIKERVGGRLKFFVSGGGALRADIAEFFAAAGLYILEGYGLTETSPVITVNRMNHFKFGKVGPCIPNVELKIAEDGEILTRGKHVMMGYFKNEEATKEVIDSDNWFHTGDIGEIDEDGFLKITDRKKDIIVTSGGKNIAPLPIEGAISSSKYVEQVMVVGDKLKFCSCIIIVAQESLKEYAKSHHLEDADDCEKLIQNPKIHDLYQSILDGVNENLARYESIKKFILKTEMFTIESDELTPKLSIRRRKIRENNEAAIAKLYED